MMSTQFEGKTVIVTGGNSGIGQATAVAFASAGAKVIVTGRRQAAVDETARLHPGIVGLVADVTLPSDAKRVAATAIEVGGGVDVLVNNAGIAQFEPLADLSIENSRSQFETNVIGLIAVSQAALGSLLERKGSIVNISSVVGNDPLEGASVYSATKAAVNALTKAWAKELAGSGVRVNAIAPGPIDTPIFGKSGLPEEQIEAFKTDISGRVPLGRIGRASEVAEWVLHLASPSATWITGQIFGVDGGLGA
ncbi:MAG: SDR family NAD(P)-dependent oxidoreductase [Capsulimonadaceae bacterium]|nr:SDR family NAD(P)-dependent oxidoreductase [Capsulimonadaceae bacterium]